MGANVFTADEPHDSVTLESALDATVEADAVTFEFAVTNAGTEPAELTFATGLAADFVAVADGEERWRASDGRLFTQALRSETLAPGETVTYRETWSDPEPGEYEVTATLEARHTSVEARTAFSA